MLLICKELSCVKLVSVGIFILLAVAVEVVHMLPVLLDLVCLQNLKVTQARKNLKGVLARHRVVYKGVYEVGERHMDTKSIN